MRKYVLLLLLVLAAGLVSGLSTTVEVQPSSATTETSLFCAVTATGTGTLQANVTWFVDGSPYISSDDTLNLTSGVENVSDESVPFSATTRSEAWICQATVTNQTNTTTTNSSARTISNARPDVDSPSGTVIVTEGIAHSDTATATDPDGDSITDWQSDDLNKSLYGGDELFEIGSDGTISFTPTYEQRGNHTMLLSAADTFGLYGSQTVLYIVNAVNQEPQFSPPLSNQNTDTDTVWEYTITGSDREGDEFNFTLVDSELDTVRLVETSNTTARLYLNTSTPLYANKGTHQITVAVYDSTNASSNTTSTFDLTIQAINTDPVLGGVNATNTTQGGQFQLNVTATDADSDDRLVFSIIGRCSLQNPWNITPINESSSGAFGQINETITNDHVACRDVTLTVTDYEGAVAKDTDSKNITLNLTNLNDPPTINEVSETAGTYDQTNMSNLSAASDVVFVYYVDADDPDLLTYDLDTLTYGDDTDLFNISSQGVINFTPDVADAGNHLINITVNDSADEQASRILNLTIISNQAPVLVQPANVSCLQDENCTVQLEATDVDAGENLTFTVELLNNSTLSQRSTNTTVNILHVGYNTSNLSKQFRNEQVGNFTYQITVTDQWGATDTAELNITINNTNDLPFFDQNNDESPDSGLSIPQPMVIGFGGSFGIGFTDEDFINGLDAVNLTQNLSGPNPSILSIVNSTRTPQDNNSFIIQYSPSIEADIGNYTVIFTLQDETGTEVNRTLNFTVYNQSRAPNITSVRPYSNQTYANVDTTNTIYALTPFNGSSINVSVSEQNTTNWSYLDTPDNDYVFDFNFSDSDSTDANITIEWYKDGSLVQTSTGDQDYSYTENIGWFEQGTTNYTVVVTDNLFSNDTFTWVTKVENQNRPPINTSTLLDWNITETRTFVNQMNVFYDADDDTDSDGEINNGETNQLTFTADVSVESVLNVSFSGTNLTLAPLEDGVVTVTYTATDASGAQTTLSATYNVTAPEEESQEQVTVSSGGGGSSSSAVPIPITDDPEPEAITILVPEPLSIAYNQTIEAPIGVSNTGEEALQSVTLTAETDAPNVTLSFDRNSFEEIPAGGVENVTLTIENFRLDGTYEILVTGESETPDANDTAVLYINSLQQSEDGAQVQTKVTFARDLLQNNNECIELNELLSQAEVAIRNNQLQEANNLIDAAVDGCRFLISEANRRQESPGYINVSAILNSPYMNYVLYGALVVVLVTGGLLVTHYVHAAQNEQEED